MAEKLLLNAALLGFLIFTSSLSFSQTLVAGDIAFTGLNGSVSTVNGTASNKDFSFILLKNITSGTIIYFTDFGWRSDDPAFQTALPCPSQTAGSGSVSDGVVKWTATTDLSYGTQVVIRCQFAPTTNIGSVIGFQKTYNSSLPGATSDQFITMAIAGESIFAYQGSLANPTLIAGMNANSMGWATSLSNCDYNPTASTLPDALNKNNYAFTLTPANQNMQLKPSLSIPTNASEALKLIADKSNWNLSATAYTMPALNPLPVRLVSIKARTQDNGDVLLDWKVTEAVNFSGFEVEKSLDAKTFSLVGEVGYQDHLDSYNYTDRSKISHIGPVYYRLKMIDKDQSYAISQILAIEIKGNSTLSDILAYPNPFAHKIEVVTGEKENKNVFVTLSNTNGTTLLSRDVAVDNSKITLEIAERLPAGIYILSVHTGIGIQKIKMIKNP